MAWTLPAPERSGYSMQEVLPVIRTQMEQGPDRVQRISSSYITDLSVQVHLTQSQMSAFRTFFEGEAEAGAAWFMMPIMTMDVLANHRVRIKSVATSPAGLGWVLRLTLETDEQVRT